MEGDGLGEGNLWSVHPDYVDGHRHGRYEWCIGLDGIDVVFRQAYGRSVRVDPPNVCPKRGRSAPWCWVVPPQHPYPVAAPRWASQGTFPSCKDLCQVKFVRQSSRPTRYRDRVANRPELFGTVPNLAAVSRVPNSSIWDSLTSRIFTVLKVMLTIILISGF